MLRGTSRAAALLAAAVLVACARRAAAPGVAPRVAPEQDVYGAVLTRLFRGAVPDTLVMAESTVVFRAPELDRAVPRWRREFEAVPAPLPRALAARSGRRVATATLPLPRPVVVLAAAERRAILAGDAEAGWAAFHRRFPRARLSLSVSPVAFSADGSEAVVYVEYGCGGLCGGGHLAWLSREAAGWVVRKVVPFWLS